MAVLLWARLGASSVVEGVPVWVASVWSSDEIWPFSPAASCSQEGPRSSRISVCQGLGCRIQYSASGSESQEGRHLFAAIMYMASSLAVGHLAGEAK